MRLEVRTAQMFVSDSKTLSTVTQEAGGGAQSGIEEA